MWQYRENKACITSLINITSNNPCTVSHNGDCLYLSLFFSSHLYTLKSIPKTYRRCSIWNKFSKKTHINFELIKSNHQQSWRVSNKCSCLKERSNLQSRAKTQPKAKDRLTQGKSYQQISWRQFWLSCLCSEQRDWRCKMSWNLIRTIKNNSCCRWSVCFSSTLTSCC